MRKILITQGDPAGVSGEIIIKTFRALQTGSTKTAQECSALIKKRKADIYVAGSEAYLKHSAGVLAYEGAISLCTGLADGAATGIKLINVCDIDMDDFSYADTKYGKEQLAYLDFAIEKVAAKEVDAVVTAPITKESVSKVIPGFLGHTGYLAEKLDAKQHMMAFYTPSFMLGLQTVHCALSEVSGKISKESLLPSIRLLYKNAVSIFGKSSRLAVLGLNPHAGEHGLMGSEEGEHISPAIMSARNEGIPCEGPFPADSFFISRYKDYAAVLSMYHDQGLTAIKSLFPRSSVNVTLGLPVVRSSVDHGSAYDIAGKGIADEGGLLEALKAALLLIG